MYYPSMLNLQGKSAVVVGGGRIAYRKILSLLEANASITLISPVITNELFVLHEEGKVLWKKKNFEPTDVTSAFLIIAATDNPNVNIFVYESINEFQLINVVDNPSLSNFIVPSYFQRGKLIISVSTSGASPLLSRKIKEKLSTIYDESYEEYLSFLEECRGKIKKTIIDPKNKKQILQKLLDETFFELTKEKKYAERDEKFQELLQKESE